MNNLNTTPGRLIWIDWAKALAITLVIFGHIPEEPGSFLVCYISAKMRSAPASASRIELNCCEIWLMRFDT